MSTANGHPLDDLAVYALDALGPEERHAVEVHLASCQQCRAELAAHHETLAVLAAPAPPPPHVWAGIAAAIEAVTLPRLPLTPAPALTPASRARHGAARPARHLADAEDPPRRRRLPVAVGLVAAAVLAVVAFVAGRQAGGPDGGVDDLAQAALADPDAVVGTLAGPGDDDVARVVTADGAAFVVLDDLAPLAADRTYQLWSLDGSAPVSLGLITHSRGAAAVALPPHAQRLALTVEAAAGATTPTGPIVARGSL